MKNVILFLFIFFTTLAYSYMGVFSAGEEITSTFGEYRGVPYHMGIDIIPKIEGDTPVHSICNGYLYRIKNKRTGYGKAVYIEDQKGLIYVYAHLKDFADTFAKKIFIPKWESEGKVYGDYYFNKDNSLKITVKKGEFIGEMGHSGVHVGDHVHFELRKNEVMATNPLNSFSFPDTVPPKIIDAYFINYYGNKFISLGCYDRMENKHKLGIYKITLNNTPVLSLDEISYNDYKKGLKVYDRSRSSYNEYFYKIPASTPIDIITVYDHKGNSDTISIKLNKKLFNWDDSFISYNIKKDDITVDIEKNHIDKGLRKKIVIIKNPGFKYVVKKKMGKISMNLFPKFLTGKMLLKIHLKPKEGIYIVKEGHDKFFSKKPSVALYANNYIIRKDREPPTVIETNGDIFIKDNSKIDYNKCYAKVGKKILQMEKDFDIDFEGRLKIFRRFKKNTKIVFYFYDIFGNRKKFKVPFYMLSFRINPFL